MKQISNYSIFSVVGFLQQRQQRQRLDELFDDLDAPHELQEGQEQIGYQENDRHCLCVRFN